MIGKGSKKKISGGSEILLGGAEKCASQDIQKRRGGREEGQISKKIRNARKELGSRGE